MNRHKLTDSTYDLQIKMGSPGLKLKIVRSFELWWATGKLTSGSFAWSEAASWPSSWPRTTSLPSATAPPWPRRSPPSCQWRPTAKGPPVLSDWRHGVWTTFSMEKVGGIRQPESRCQLKIKSHFNDTLISLWVHSYYQPSFSSHLKKRDKAYYNRDFWETVQGCPILT